MTNNPHNTVVILGGRSEREFTIARELGYRVVLLDEEVPWHCMPWVDTPVDVDTNDEQAVTEAIVRHLGSTPPAAVLTHTEPRLPMMARLAHTLCPTPRGLTESAALNCRDKLRTRTVLAGAGLPVPAFARADGIDAALDAAQTIGYPVIIKPRDGAGAFGVRLARTADDVCDAVRALKEQPAGQRDGLLVEEYVGGPEYAVQTVTVDGVTRVLSVFRQHVTEPPVFVELGYDHPCGLPDKELDDLARLMQDALVALGVDNWITHTQVRLGQDGFRIIEVNARRPGGRLVEMTRAVSGVDMTEAVTCLALGLDRPAPGPTLTHARYTSIVFDQAGFVTYQPGATRAPRGLQDPVVELEVAPGESVQPKDHPHGGVYGRIVVFGSGPDDLDEAERTARAELDLRLTHSDGLDWTAGDSREFKSCC